MSYIDKTTAREFAKKRRSSIPARDRDGAGLKAAAFFRKRFTIQQPSIISAYWPLPAELDCRPLIHALAKDGHHLALPAVTVQTESMCFRRWQPGNFLTKSALGVLEPLANAEEITPNIVIIPFLAVDAQGFRLGYGGGYYDRALRSLREIKPDLLAIGLGFSAQETETLPYDENDEQLDWLVTEKGTRQFQR